MYTTRVNVLQFIHFLSEFLCLLVLCYMQPILFTGIMCLQEHLQSVMHLH